MRLVSLKVSGYRQYLDQSTLQIPSGLIGICGPNGVGKSKLIEAIGYALYGPASAILPQYDRAADLAAKAGRAIPRVELEIEIHGQRYVICRTTRGTTSIQLLGATDTIAEGAAAVTQKVIELLRLTADAYCGTFVARQNEVIGLQSTDGSRRRRIVNRLIGITQVEYAIEFAKEIKGERTGKLATAQAKLQINSNEAQQRLDEKQAELGAAIEARTAQERAVKVTEGELRTAQAKWSAIERRQHEAAQHQKSIQRLALSEVDAEKRVRSANERLQAVQSAIRALADAEVMLQQTAEVPTMLSYYELLVSHKNVLQQQQRLANELAQRTQLAAERAEVEAALGQLTVQIGEYNALVIQAETEAKQARHEAEKQEHHRDTVAQLGPDGICDACGQILGDSFHHALQRRTTEASEARKREHAAQEQAQSARKIIAVHDQEQEKKQTRRDELISQHEALDTVPGQIEATRDELERMEGLLAVIPAALRELPYNAATHQELRAMLERREEALRTRAQQQVHAAQEGEVSRELDQANDALQTLQSQRVDLEKAIATTMPSTEEEMEAKVTLTAALKAYDRVEEEHRKTVETVATATERVRYATDELKRSQEQEQLIAVAHRDLFIADETEKVLQQLLLEIAAEARPRIVEMMETWMRALLGPRFQTVDLTDDYQLKADNGSGLHPISHFSGGEQTLLAIMLRVAISIFCRERAGFETSFLVLDEVFGNQDTEHRQQLVDFLNEIKVHYHQILIVNHIEDVTAMLDNIIDVVPTGSNTSKTQLR
jgi:DNA repair exonuclease SbcCD ATPase subunit